MLNPLLEAVSQKLIINRKRIISGIQNKYDYHKSMADMYQEKATNSDDPKQAKRAKINVWRHKKEADRLKERLDNQKKILAKLQESFNLVFEYKRANPANQEDLMNNPWKVSKCSMSSVFKPINISGLSIKTRNMIMKESRFKLAKITALASDLKIKATNPTNKNVQRDRVQLKYCNLAFKIHHEFINKTLFWKSRTKFVMGPQYMQLKEQYTRSLFNLEQDYKREELQLNPVDTSNY